MGLTGLYPWRKTTQQTAGELATTRGGRGGCPSRPDSQTAISQVALAGSQQEPGVPVKGWGGSQATADFPAEPVPRALPGKRRNGFLWRGREKSFLVQFMPSRIRQEEDT